jgi:hypothetical protein
MSGGTPPAVLVAHLMQRARVLVSWSAWRCSRRSVRFAPGVARLRLLLHFVDALEKHISNAAESAFSFSPAELRASLFFRANRKASRVPHSTAGTGLCHSRRRTEAQLPRR